MNLSGNTENLPSEKEIRKMARKVIKQVKGIARQIQIRKNRGVDPEDIITEGLKKEIKRVRCIVPLRRSGVHPDDRISLIPCKSCPIDQECDQVILG